ncbi:hypothetical protein N866_20080 [Actinotalea ferrariae CF5-4]|uniref:Uncharacterized protein n=1 Tax=Actinotalea ferrariae CF5-4 TaxID=948458 RepID=A0A021VTZ9_9CELL|nr:hypothetical protein [Actinotalea ferrariae]EYR63515.1 hypothetical protein N866_20080 [Actinotalea ferrariae CF5-4]
MDSKSVSVSLEALAGRCAVGAVEPLAPPLYACGDATRSEVEVAVRLLVSGERRWPVAQVLAVDGAQAEVLDRWAVVPVAGSATGVVVDGVVWLLAACALMGVRPAWVEESEWEAWGVPALREDGRSVVWVGPGGVVPAGAVALPRVMPTSVALFDLLVPVEVAEAVAVLRARTVGLEVASGSVVEVLGRCLVLAAQDAYEGFHA